MNDSTSLVLGIISFLLFVVLYVWLALALSALFRKAGEEGWKGWVPYYNLAIVLKLGGFSPWLIFIVLVPLFGLIAYLVLRIIATYRISRAFGYGVGMTVLGAFFFIVWASILGFGSARWIGAAPTVGPMRSGSSPYPEPAGSVRSVDASSAAAAPASSSVESAPADIPPSPAPWAPQPPEAGVLPAPPPLPTVAMPVVPAAFSSAPPQPSPAEASADPWSPQPSRADSAPAEKWPAEPSPPMPSSLRPYSQPLDDGLEDSAVDPEDRIPAAPRRTGYFTPPPLPDGPVAPAVDPIAPIASVPGARQSEPQLSAEAPVTDVPPAPPTADEPEPWAPMPTRPPAASDDGFPELSEAVSAVIGAPDAGSPRSARSSVSALYAQPEIPADAADSDDDDDDDLEAMDQTVIARRRRIPWALIPPGGAPVDISADVVILGRRPAADPAYPGAQLVSISDETRTVSKTHARLELRGETWYVTDLGSTNGVLFATLMGTEVEAQPGQEIEAGERFFLGDAEVRLTRSEA